MTPEEPSEAGSGPLIPQPRYRLPEWYEIERLLKQRGSEWDALTSVIAPEIGGNEVEFVVLQDGSLIVDAEEGEASLVPLADAVEVDLARPYRALGIRQEDGVWAIGARRVDIVELRGIRADHLERTVYEGTSTATVDGDLEPLDTLAADRGLDDYVIQADRLEDDLWEARITPL